MLNKRDVLKVQKARSYQELLVPPPTADFREYVANSNVANMDITVDDVDRAMLLFGEPVPSIRGKFKRPSPKSHGQGRKADFDPSLKGMQIDLYVDVMHIEGQMFLACKGRRVDYIKCYPTQQMPL